MSRLVILCGKVNPGDRRSHSESESEQGVESYGIYAKLSDLPLARMNSG
jgi:hypothetical protein